MQSCGKDDYNSDDNSYFFNYNYDNINIHNNDNDNSNDNNGNDNDDNDNDNDNLIIVIMIIIMIIMIIIYIIRVLVTAKITLRGNLSRHRGRQSCQIFLLYTYLILSFFHFDNVGVD